MHTRQLGHHEAHEQEHFQSKRLVEVRCHPAACANHLWHRTRVLTVCYSQDDKESIRSVSRLDIAQQRARTISMRLGTEVQTWEMRAAQPSETVLRQDRPVAMRVRWACHRCTDSMGSNGICSNCNHSRCKKCSRLHQHSEADSELVGMRPSRRRLAGDDEGFEASEPALTDYMLRKRSKTGGQDLVLRKPRHRVRRTCHVCKADFAQLSKICEKCQHVRCTDCPRDP